MVDRRKTNDLSISDYVQAARFHPWAVVLPMVVIGILTWLALGRGGDVYRAEAQVVVSASEAQQGFDSAIADKSNDVNFLPNEVRFAKGDAVLNQIRAALGADAPENLDDLDLEVTADTEADALNFTAEDATSQGAADLANAYARVYVEQRRAAAVLSYDATIATINGQLDELRTDRATLRIDLDAVIVQIAGLPIESSQRPALEARRATIEAQLGPQLTSVDNQETALVENLSRLKISQSLASSGIAQVTTAAVPDPDPKPNAGTRALIVGEIVGLILGLLAAVTLENRNDRLREPGEVEQAFPNLPILGSIPYDATVRKRREVTVLAAPHSSFSEAIYQVRTSLRFMTMEQGVRLVVVTSPNPSEGKTTFTANFAWALAGLDEPVVLIDGDLRRPVAHQHFGVELTPGLTDLIIDKRPLSSIAVRFEEQDGNLSLVPAGTHHGNPADFMGSMQLVDRLRAISNDVLTVVDAAPVLPVSDSRALAGASDLTILMVRLGATRRSEVAAAVANLRNAGARSIALVLVGVKPETSTYYTGGEGRGRHEGPAHPTALWRLPVSGANRPSMAVKAPISPDPRLDPRVDPRRVPSSSGRDSGPQLPPRLADAPVQAGASPGAPKQAPANTGPPRTVPAATGPTKQPPATTGPTKQPPATTEPTKQPPATTEPTKQPPATTGPTKQPPATTGPTKPAPAKLDEANRRTRPRPAGPTTSRPGSNGAPSDERSKSQGPSSSPKPPQSPSAPPRRPGEGPRSS